MKVVRQSNVKLLTQDHKASEVADPEFKQRPSEQWKVHTFNHPTILPTFHNIQFLQLLRCKRELALSLIII